MTTLEQIIARTTELQQLHASGVHRQDIQDEINRLYERYRAERAGAAPPEMQPAPPKKRCPQRREARGGSAPRTRCKLTEQQVVEIRARWGEEGGRRGLQKELCQEYGAGKSTIGDIVHGRSYRHLNDRNGT